MDKNNKKYIYKNKLAVLYAWFDLFDDSLKTLGCINNRRIHSPIILNTGNNYFLQKNYETEFDRMTGFWIKKTPIKKPSYVLLVVILSLRTLKINYHSRKSRQDHFFQVPNKDFSYGKNEILQWAEQVDALVLINPDNPSGNFIPVEDIKDIVKEFQAKDKILILDESFVDFATGGAVNSLLDNSLLKEFPNLMVMKSISKSYGVPGLRLGVLGSSNKELITACRQRLSIWNINSFAEFFLQIYGKYEKSYLSACEKIAGERDRFYKKLNKISFLHTYPSQANYFLCDVKDIESTQLVARLLKEEQIFIKDLKGKKGFENKNCIRIAVRNKKDNDRLLGCLEEIIFIK